MYKNDWSQQRSIRKMWSWNYWQKERIEYRRDLEIKSDYKNLAQSFDKCDPKGQKYRQELTPNAKSQRCRMFVVMI